MLENQDGHPEDVRLALSVVDKTKTRRGFTLFEVGISLVLVAFGVISVMMLFPMGIKAEQMSRMRLFAGIKAEEILDSFATLPNDNPGIDIEAPFAWEVPVAHRPLVPDLEVAMAAPRNGIMPVPLEIARRLESENDEIRTLIQQGGYLYYSKPTGASGFEDGSEMFNNRPKDPLVQRVVFAVLGNAQNNAVSVLPQKAWPYYNPYPSGPSWGVFGGADAKLRGELFRNSEKPSNPPDSTDVSFRGNVTALNDEGHKSMETTAENGSSRGNAYSLWEGTNGGVPLAAGELATGSLDPDIKIVFTNGYRPYAASDLFSYKDLVDNLDFGQAPQPGAPVPVSFGSVVGKGQGYAEGDILTVVGDTGTAATFKVNRVSRATDTPVPTILGQVYSVSLVSGGSVTATAPNPHTTTAVTPKPAPAPAVLSNGTGCTLELRYGNLYRETLLGAKRYIQSALWYCERKGVDDTYCRPAIPATVADAVALAAKKAKDFCAISAAEKWKYVQAIRFLSHAATCITYYARKADVTATPATPLLDPNGAGILVEELKVPQSMKQMNDASLVRLMPEITINNNLVVYYHELSLRIAMLYAASQPYDWGAPRPTQRAVFTDHPLIEYDLNFDSAIPAPANEGFIYGSDLFVNGRQTGRQWRPIPACPITNIGRSASFPNTPIPFNPAPAGSAWSWGNPDHFSLTKQFEPKHRCRELVFWAVDWLSYVDSETAPSAPVDASREPFSAPLVHLNGTPYDFSKSNSTRRNYIYTAGQYNFAFRAPETDRCWSKDISTYPTGLYFPFRTGDQYTGQNNPINKDGVESGNGVTCGGGSGAFGADRNGNRILDRGPVPQSTRLRATTLSRYNFYDPRLTLRLR